MALYDHEECVACQLALHLAGVNFFHDWLASAANCAQKIVFIHN